MNRFEKMGGGAHASITAVSVVLAVGFAATATLCVGAYAETRIILRMDDEGFGRHRDMASERGLSDAAMTQGILQLIAKHDAKLTIGVIPNVACGSPSYRSEHHAYRLLSSAPQEVAALRQGIVEGYAEVALHGWTHEALCVSDAHSSEFAGLSLEEQSHRLAEGKKEVEQCLGTPVGIFVPPFNSHDCATLRALETVGFRTITSTAQPSDTNDDLYYVPETTALKALMSVAPEAVLSETPALVVVVFHVQDFFESGSEGSWLSFDDFDGFLARWSSHPGIEFTSIQAELQRNGNAFTAKNSRLYASYRDRIGRLTDMLSFLGLSPDRTKRLLPSMEVIYPERHMRRRVVLMLAIEIVVNFGVLVVTALVIHRALKFGFSHSWSRGAPAWFLVGGCLALAILLGEGTFGVLSAPGFGSRLVLATSAAGGLLTGSAVGVGRMWFGVEKTAG